VARHPPHGYLAAMEGRFRIEDPAGAAARREAAVQRLRDETGIDEPMIDAWSTASTPASATMF